MKSTGVILVGGLGTRLRPLTYQTPKPLLPLFHSSLLYDQCQRLSKVAAEIVLLTCYKAEMLRKAIKKISLAVPVTVLEEHEPLGTGGAIWAQREFLRGEYIFILNGDVIQRVDYVDYFHFFLETGRSGCLLAKRVQDARRYGLIQIEAGDRIAAFLEKPTEKQPGWINAGAYLFKRSLLEKLPEGKSSIELEAFPVWANQKELAVYRYEDYWIDIGTAQSYLQAHFDFIEKRWRLSDPAAFDGFVWDEERKVILHTTSSVAQDAEVGPLVVLYPGSRVGSGARIRESILLEGSSVEKSLLRNAIVATRTRVSGGKDWQTGILI